MAKYEKKLKHISECTHEQDGELDRLKRSTIENKNQIFDQQEFVSQLKDENLSLKSQVKDLKQRLENANLMAYGNKNGPAGKNSITPKSSIIKKAGGSKMSDSSMIFQNKLLKTKSIIK